MSPCSFDIIFGFHLLSISRYAIPDSGCRKVTNHRKVSNHKSTNAILLTVDEVHPRACWPFVFVERALFMIKEMLVDSACFGVFGSIAIFFLVGFRKVPIIAQ